MTADASSIQTQSTMTRYEKIRRDGVRYSSSQLLRPLFLIFILIYGPMIQAQDANTTNPFTPNGGEANSTASSSTGDTSNLIDSSTATNSDPTTTSSTGGDIGIITDTTSSTGTINPNPPTDAYTSPSPVIYDVNPTSGGPGTRVKLIGANLGINSKDIFSITIGYNITCGSIEYTSSNRVTCTVGIPASYKAQVDSITQPLSGGSAVIDTIDEFHDLTGGEDILPIIITTISGGPSTLNQDWTTQYFAFQIPPILRVSISTGNDELCVTKTARCASLHQAIAVYAANGATFLLEDGVYLESDKPIPILYPQISIQGLSNDPSVTKMVCSPDGCFSYGPDMHEFTDAAASGATKVTNPQVMYFYPRMLSGITFQQAPFVDSTANENSTIATRLPPPAALPVGLLFALELHNSLLDSSSSCGSSNYGNDLLKAAESIRLMVEQNMNSISGSTTTIFVDSNNNTQVITPSSTSSTPLFFRNCVFTDVSSATGPVISIADSNVVFQRCTFTRNTNINPQLTGSGGAMFISDGSTVVIQESMFGSNRASYGGALTATENSRLSITDTSFVWNTAKQSGGAIYITSGSMVNITNCVFSNNLASSFGGAIYAEKSMVLAKTITFNDNMVGQDKQDLMSVTLLPPNAFGGGAIKSVVSAFLLDDCIFDRNIGGYPSLGDGGAIAATYSSLSISHSYFNSNLAARGGAMSTETLSNVDISWTTFHRNIAGYGPSQLTSARALGILLNSTLNLGSALSGQPERWGQGGALYWTGFTTSSMDHVEFVSNIANDGGAMYLDRAAAPTTTTLASPSSINIILTMTNVTFSINSASGRSINSLTSTLQSLNGDPPPVKTNTTTAPPVLEMAPLSVNGGGAIVSLSTSFSCIGCSFISNSAPMGGGGALLWQDDWALNVANWRGDEAVQDVASRSFRLATYFPRSIIIPVNLTQWDNNQALYGNHFATVAADIRAAIREPVAPWRIFPVSADLAPLDEDVGFGVQDSGHTLNPSVAVELLDAYGQRVCMEDSSSNGLRVRVVADQLPTDTDLSFPATGKILNNLAQLGTGIRPFTKGLANFTDLGILSLPSTNVTLVFETLLYNGQVISTAKSSTVGVSYPPPRTSSVILIQLRSCQPGEYLDVSSTRCVPCATGTASLTINAYQCDMQEVTVPPSQIYALMFIFLMLLSIEVLAFIGIIYFRKHRVIFSASPLFLCMILTGGFLCLVAAILMIQQPLATTTVSCITGVWCLNIGFMLCYGSMVSKTYRLYRIFDNALFAPVAISNRQLLTMVLGLCSFDALVLTIWQGAAPTSLQVDQYRICVSDLSWLFTPMLIASKALLILYGSFLTYKVRGIPSNYNESRFLAGALFTVGFLSFVILSLQWGLGSSIPPPTLNTVQSVSVAFGSFFSLAFIFAPHFFNIYVEEKEKRKNEVIRMMKLELKNSKRRSSPLPGSNHGSLSVTGTNSSVGSHSPMDPRLSASPSPTPSDPEPFKHMQIAVDAADYLLPPLPIPGVISHLIKQFSQKRRRHPLEHQFVQLSSELESAIRAESLSLKRLSENRRDIVQDLRKLSQIHFEMEFQIRVNGGLDEKEMILVNDKDMRSNSINGGGNGGNHKKDSTIAASSARTSKITTRSVPSRRTTINATAPSTATNTPRTSMVRSYDSIPMHDNLELTHINRGQRVESHDFPVTVRDRNDSGGQPNSNPLSLANTPDRTPFASRRPSQVEILSTIRDELELLSSPDSSELNKKQTSGDEDQYANMHKDFAFPGVILSPPSPRSPSPQLNDNDLKFEVLDPSPFPTLLSPPAAGISPNPTGGSSIHSSNLLSSSSPPVNTNSSPLPQSILSPSLILNDVENQLSAGLNLPPSNKSATPSPYRGPLNSFKKEKEKPPLPKKMRSTSKLMSPFSPTSAQGPPPSNPSVRLTPTFNSVSVSPLSPPPRLLTMTTRMNRQPDSSPTTPTADSSSSSSSARVLVQDYSLATPPISRPITPNMIAPQLRIHPVPIRQPQSGSKSVGHTPLGGTPTTRSPNLSPIFGPIVHSNPNSNLMPSLRIHAIPPRHSDTSVNLPPPSKSSPPVALSPGPPSISPNVTPIESPSVNH